MIFIECPEQLDQLKDKELLCIPVVLEKSHHTLDELLFLYFIDLNDKLQYIINLNHDDYIKFNGNCVIEAQCVITTNKKILEKYGILKSKSLDLNFLIYPTTHKSFNFLQYIPISYLIHKKRFSELTTYPLSILIHMCNTASAELYDLYATYKKYLDDLLKIDEIYYNSLFLTERNKINYADEIIYSDYNPYTITNRPTNTSYNINLSALSKKNNIRDNIKSVYYGGELIQYDYSAFHLYLLSKMLNFNIPTGVDAYVYINSLYHFSSNTDRHKIKLDFFKHVYNKDLPDTQLGLLIGQFRQKLMHEFLKNGYVTTMFLKRKAFFTLPVTISENKIFNYFLQTSETEYNLYKIQQLNQYFSNKKSVLILYTYDSFLIDQHPDENYIITDIKNILESDGFPVKIQIGRTYGTLEDIYI